MSNKVFYCFTIHFEKRHFLVVFFAKRSVSKNRKLQADSAEDFGWANLRRTDKTNVRIVNQKALK